MTPAPRVPFVDLTRTHRALGLASTQAELRAPRAVDWRPAGPARHPKAPPAGRHRPSQPQAPGPRPPGPAGRRPSTRKARARCPQQAGRWQCSTRASDQDTGVNIHARASMSTNNSKQRTRNCRAATRQGEDTATRKGNKAIHLYRISCL